MTSNRLCLASVVIIPLVLVVAAWAAGILPALDAWRWKAALVIHNDPVGLALVFFSSLLAGGRAIDMIRARYAAADARPRR